MERITNAGWMVENYIEFSQVKNIARSDGYTDVISGDGLLIGRYPTDLLTYEEWLDSIHHDMSILTDAEKEYLGSIIKPFRKYVISIRKSNSASAQERITILWNDYAFGRSSFALPTFEKGRYYKGMVSGRNYTIQELGL